MMGCVAWNCSCSVGVALLMKEAFAISVIVDDTWLAAASRRLTGDIPAPVAWLFVATTRLLRVASARSLRDRRMSRLTSSDRGLRSNCLRSSVIAVTALTTAFIGARTRVGELLLPAVNKLSTAETNAVIWISNTAPSGDMGKLSSVLGGWRNSWDVAK